MRAHRTLAAAFALVAAVPGTVAAAPGTVTGLWRTEGYGTVIDLGQGRMRAYETTAISCLPGFTAERDGQGAYRTADHETYRIQRDGTGARLTVDGSPGHRVLRRIPALPAACTRPPATDPRATFDVFWQTFAENYPFFAAKRVDWTKVRDRYRPLVTAATSPARLAEILNAMIAPLHDAHTGVITGDAPPVVHLRPGTTLPSLAYDQKIKAYVEKQDLHGPLTEFAKGRIGYADLPGQLGYLRISGFTGYTGYTDADDFAANDAELSRVLDGVFTAHRVRTLRGLVIDLRVNGGGDDTLGLRVAARLTARPYIAYAKRARNDPGDPARFTTPQPIAVRPAHAPVYTGPVALLTGGSTMSAGETFTQALMDRVPAPVRIGRNTQGVFSDILDRQLPNGWTFGLPNEEFLTRAGRTYDGRGIPPQVRAPEVTGQGDDRAFERAVASLEDQRKPATERGV